MKRIFQIIGLISLTCFSFFITEKTATVVNNLDDIMVQIKEQKENFKTKPIDATISDNTIIPGVNGRKVNVKKSYKNMKINGYFSDKLFIYDYIKPKISLSDNLNKYIIKGNPSKRMISLIFILSNEDNIDDILTILNNYNVGSTFFVDYTWFTNNTDKVKQIINNGHLISPYMEDYTNSNFEWMDMILKKVNKQKYVFCYNEIENNSNLEICSLKGDYTLRPIIISDKTPLVDIKNKEEVGSLFVLSNNSEVKKELSSIIIYLKSKGYKLTNLEEHLIE